MTMKTKRGLVIGGGTVLCAALAILIAARFAPELEAVAPSTPEVSSVPAVSVEISTSKREETKPIEIEKPAESNGTEQDNKPPKSIPIRKAKTSLRTAASRSSRTSPNPKRITSRPLHP